MPILSQTFVRVVERFAEIDSTNDWGKLRAASDDCPLPLLILADRQTAGRGRGSNRWWSEEGSLTFSLVVGPEWTPEDRAQTPLAALAVGVAVVDALAPLVSQQIGLHWPNDVFVDQRKLGGLLIETLPNRRAVVGIGLNVNNALDVAPVEVRQAAVSLRDLSGARHDRLDVLVRVLVELERQFARLRDDPAAVAGRADELCLQHGQTLTLDTGRRLVTGRCLGIAADGCLRLETCEGPQSFASGALRRPTAR